MRSLLLHIVACLLKVGAFFFRMLPIRKRVVFMSRQGRGCSKDFELLADALARRFDGLEIAFCLSEPETKNLAAFAKSTMRQLRFAQTSSVVVVDGYLPAVCVPSKRHGVTVIQLWHALGAIKRFGYQCLDTPDGRSSESARILRMHRNYDYVIAGGPWAVSSLAEAFDVPSGAVLPFGLPRVDYLSSPRFQAEREKVREKIFQAYPQLNGSNPNILYAPTFRRNDPGYSSKQLELACKAARGLPANVVFSGHPLDGSDENTGGARNAVSARGFSTIELLLVADALVTDYSAVAYEAVAVGIPVFFYVPDIDEYRKTPGLNVDPKRDFSGCCAEDLTDVLRMACSRSCSGSLFAEASGEVPTDCVESLVGLIERSLG